MEASDLDAPAKLGLLTRVKSGFAGLAGRFKRTPAPEPENGEGEQTPKAHDKPGTQTEDTPTIRPKYTKKRLIIGGAIGLIILLLTGIGFATWKIFLSPPEHDAAAPAQTGSSHDSPTAAGHATAEQADTHQAEIEALKKKNEDLQAQIEAMKKESPPDQPSSPPSGVAEENAASSASTGELTISNKDPKAAAQTLKEAIEAMNAGSGTPARKPAK
jgi:hypothetical protein